MTRTFLLSDLIALGRAKGFVTYDEINEHMPPSITASKEIGSWLSALDREGIVVVDSASDMKGRDDG